MIIAFIKNLLTKIINLYKFRKYSDHFSEGVTFDETALILPFLGFLVEREIKVVYNVGAATGEFATALAKQHNIIKVIAFEPLPDSWRVLCVKTAGNEKIAVFNTAIGDSESTVRFYVTADGDSSSCLPPSVLQADTFPGRGLVQEITVPMTTLDAISRERCLPAPDILIMDVQGFEMNVLRGAAKCLASAKYCILECCFVTLYESAPLVDDIWDYMRASGWHLVGVGPQCHNKDGKPVFLDLVFQNPARS